MATVKQRVDQLNSLREKFLEFFRTRHHAVVPPSSLIPDDPSVLLTTAGMQQFKPYYTGDFDPEADVHASLGKPLGAKAAASIQPCVRTSDIEEVGDATHLTLFEMMGNFAFQGGYFKKEAIEYAFEFVTAVANLPKDELYVTVFGGDDFVPYDKDSYAVWREIGVPDEKISEGARADNFWGPTGDSGPCGPTTEIHLDVTRVPCEKGKACLPNCDCGRFLEIWNLVFNEYFCDKDGGLTHLTATGVDTGMGFERLALVYFSVPDVFATPFFEPVMRVIAARSPRIPEAVKEQVPHEDDAQRLFRILYEKCDREVVRSMRVVADHLRASAFLIQEGIRPSNTDREYILRRLLRRATLHARQLALPEGWIEPLLGAVLKPYAEVYPELLEAKAEIAGVVEEERQKFIQGLEKGMKEFARMAQEKQEQDAAVTGEDVFTLFETYGFPIEMSVELATEQGLAVKIDDLDEVREEHRQRSRAGAEQKFGGHGLILDTGELKAATEEEVVTVTRLHTATHMLQAALRQVLGDEVEQRGSDITAERLRFDFSFPRKVTDEELQTVEALVNEYVAKDIAVEREEMPFQEAVDSGALAFAKGAYPEVVSVYSIPGFSKEVCGGPHVSQTGEVGTFRILKEEASSAGVRRIRAVVEDEAGDETDKSDETGRADETE